MRCHKLHASNGLKPARKGYSIEKARPFTDTDQIRNVKKIKEQQLEKHIHKETNLSWKDKAISGTYPQTRTAPPTPFLHHVSSTIQTDTSNPFRSTHTSPLRNAGKRQRIEIMIVD